MKVSGGGQKWSGRVERGLRLLELMRRGRRIPGPTDSQVERLGHFLSVALVVIGSLGFAAPMRAQGNVDDALMRATQFLLQSQDAASGAINNRNKEGKVRVNRDNVTAMTSLSVLALAATGHQPGDATPEGAAMRKALGFVLRPETQDKDGYFGDFDGSRMYGHGIITLTLAEMLGMGADSAQDALIREKCRKGTDLILRAQKVRKNEASDRGGWRYTADAAQSDLSVTVWQVMALRAAKNAGMDVPKEAIDDAVAYIKRLYSPGDEKQPALYGGFGYTGPSRETSTTAEGLLALQVCGQYDAPEVLGASAKLLRDGVDRREKWFFYTTYYYAQGMYQRGGKFAEEGRRVVADLLLARQARDGSWESEGGEEKEAGRVYTTTMAVLSLAVKNHFLPIYQR